MVREANENDLDALLELYLNLHADFRGKGYATECLNYAREIARKNNMI